MPVPAAPTAAEPPKGRLEAFKEEWDARLETALEVVEGSGGHTDWSSWEDAVRAEDKSFAPTVPMSLPVKDAATAASVSPEKKL